MRVRVCVSEVWVRCEWVSVCVSEGECLCVREWVSECPRMHSYLYIFSTGGLGLCSSPSGVLEGGRTTPRQDTHRQRGIKTSSSSSKKKSAHSIVWWLQPQCFPSICRSIELLNLNRNSMQMHCNCRFAYSCPCSRPLHPSVAWLQTLIKGGKREKSGSGNYPSHVNVSKTWNSRRALSGGGPWTTSSNRLQLNNT